jgi:hypothetical protein
MNELNPLICSIAMDIDLKLLVSNYPINLRHHNVIKILITNFTCHENQKGAMRYYTEFTKLYILYYSLKMSGLLFHLIHFLLGLKENIWTDTYHCIVPFSSVFLFLITTEILLLEESLPIFAFHFMK